MSGPLLRDLRRIQPRASSIPVRGHGSRNSGGERSDNYDVECFGFDFKQHTLRGMSYILLLADCPELLDCEHYRLLSLHLHDPDINEVEHFVHPVPLQFDTDHADDPHADMKRQLWPALRNAQAVLRSESSGELRRFVQDFYALFGAIEAAREYHRAVLYYAVLFFGAVQPHHLSFRLAIFSAIKGLTDLYANAPIPPYLETVAQLSHQTFLGREYHAFTREQLWVLSRFSCYEHFVAQKRPRITSKAESWVFLLLFQRYHKHNDQDLSVTERMMDLVSHTDVCNVDTPRIRTWARAWERAIMCYYDWDLDSTEYKILRQNSKLYEWHEFDVFLDILSLEDKDPNVGLYGVLVYPEWYKGTRKSEEYMHLSTCSVCFEKLTSIHYPNSKITSTCDHSTATCRNCLREHLDYQVDEIMTFPDCMQPLSIQDVQRWASESTYLRYEELDFRRTLKQQRSFHECSSPDCNSGQFHFGSGSNMTCAACGFVTCVHHKKPWHEGLTCDEFDAQGDLRTAQEKASDRLIALFTKCPECMIPIEKNNGCDHFTCKRPQGCGYEFCWKCLASWRKIMRNGWKEHKSGCPYRNSNLPAMAPLAPEIFLANGGGGWQHLLA